MIAEYMMRTDRILKILLFLMSIHSMCVGIALIVTPVEMFSFFGYTPVTEKFFPVQGGVFHIIMSFVYYWAGKNLGLEQG